MPRITLNEELGLIESIVASHPAGIGISALEAEMEQHLGTPPQRRTLQRRLLKLIEEQRLVTEGESIVLVYKLAAGAVASSALSAAGAAPAALEVAQAAWGEATQAAPEPAEPEVELEVPLSPEGAAIATQVRRAPMYRRPIGYQLEFLHAYQPGETFYLPESTRRQLHQIGRTPQSGQPAGTYARDILGQLRVDWSWASSRLEGNSYRRPEAQTLIELGRYPHKGRWGASAADHDAVAKAMAATDTARFAGRAVNTLSGGERARVLLARVLAGEPEWLLADEPFANLDPAHQLDGMAALRRVAAAGAGVVVVVHDLNLALQLADDVILLRAGKIIAAGAAAAVLTPALIAETYQISVEIGTTAAGARFIVAGPRLSL